MNKTLAETLASLTWGFPSYEGYMCGATQDQKNLSKETSQFFNQLTGSYASEFGDASNVFNTLSSAFTPMVQAGPGQKGLSAQEETAMRTEASDTNSTQFENAKRAIGENLAARGGGNSFLPSGGEAQLQAELNMAGAKQEAGTQNDITKYNYETGRQNYWNAAKGLAGSTDVFNPTTGAANAATSAGESATTAANNVATAGNAWMGAVGGVLGGLASNITMPGLGGAAKGASGAASSTTADGLAAAG